MEKDSYHFIGIGGIGMSALARILLQKGCTVTGSDINTSLITEELVKEGATVTKGHHKEAIQAETKVIYSSDIKAENEELEQAKGMRLPLFHRSDLLDLLMKEKKPLLVTGTHGKTTTTSLLSYVLYAAGVDPSFVIGGILKELGTNGKEGKGPYFVAEADESDGSFLKTAAFGAIVTNFNLDHLSYWQTEENLGQGFIQFFQNVTSKKHLFWCIDDKRLSTINPEGISYGFSEKAKLQILKYKPKDTGVLFDVAFEGKKYSEIYLNLLGKHNVLNGAAVFGLCLALGVSEDKIRASFRQFTGTKRRLDKKGEIRKVEVFDDYGHHPVEIAATIDALKNHVKERRLVVVFQPHRYTRVRDLLNEFPDAFLHADTVFLTDIYSAGEAPIAEVNTASFYRMMKDKLGSKLHFSPRAHLEEAVSNYLKPLDVVLTIGAGDITHAGGAILSKWDKRGERLKVAILCGGMSAEHDVSVLSAINLGKAADKDAFDLSWFLIGKRGNWVHCKDIVEVEGLLETEDGKITPEIVEKISMVDVAMPILHGPKCEDGMIQGFLDTLQIPYVGTDYRSSPLCMDKRWTKEMAILHGIPTAPFFCMKIEIFQKDPEELANRIENSFSYPCWVKPLHLGSSIGVSRVNKKEDLFEKAKLAFQYDETIIVEKHIEGKQIEFGLMGNQYIWVGPPCEILNDGRFVDYEGKYGEKAFPYQIPAHISEIDTQLGLELAKKVYQFLECKGLSRIDFFYDQEGHYWLNEVNPFPGCTNTSAFPKICEKANISMGEVFDSLIACALERSRRIK